MNKEEKLLEMKLILNQKILSNNSKELLNELTSNLYNEKNVNLYIKDEIDEVLSFYDKIKNNDKKLLLGYLLDALKFYVKEKNGLAIKKILNLCNLLVGEPYSFYDELIETKKEDLKEFVNKGKEYDRKIYR